MLVTFDINKRPPSVMLEITFLREATRWEAQWATVVHKWFLFDLHEVLNMSEFPTFKIEILCTKFDFWIILKYGKS